MATRLVKKVQILEGNNLGIFIKRVGEEEKRDKVLGVFDNVAENYDLMNDAMSFGVHRLWKDCFMKRLNPGQGTRLLDVAGGTGDIAFRFLDHVGRKGEAAEVVVCDINESMLSVGEKRATK